MRLRPLTLALAAAAAAVALAACGDDDSGAADGPQISATTGIVADIAERIAGPDAEVVQVIPDSVSPHDFSLSAKDRAEIENSALLVANGAGLEAGIPIDGIAVPSIALAANAGQLRRFDESDHEDEADDHADEDEHGDEETDEHADEEEHGDEEGDEHADEDVHGDEEGDHADEDEHADEAGDGHAHGGFDPHVWMDPTRVAAALPALAEALAEADPDHADGYRERAEEYADELRELDGEIERELEAIPEANRRLVTSHDALGYFADRYDFEIVGAPFAASGAEAEPSAAAIRDLQAAIRSSGVPAVFSEETDNPEVLRRIAEATGVEIVTELLVESPGDAGSYAEMLRRDAQLLGQALGG